MEKDDDGKIYDPKNGSLPRWRLTMEFVELIGYWMACLGLSLAVSKFYVGKFFRETVSRLSDEDFDSGVNKEKDGEFDYYDSWSWWQSYVGRFVRCPACIGFWLSMMVAVPYRFGVSLQFDVPWYEAAFQVVTMGFGASAFSITGWMVLVKLGIKGDPKKEDDSDE